MAVKPADMDDCSIKTRCVGGVNDGVAYDPQNPCFSGLTFDDSACDCFTEASYIGAWGYSNMTNLRSASSIVVNIEPSYDGLGRLRTYTAGVAELPCGSGEGSSFETSPCGEHPSYSGGVTITRLTNCTGGGATVGNQYIFAYIDGVLDNVLFMNTAVGLGCGADDDFRSGVVGWFYGDTVQEVEDQLDAWTGGSGPPSSS